MTASAALNTARRRGELERLAAGEGVDLVVIGGGITGTGVALDAAARGLRVALFEREDLAHGTSRWSSKLIHGGLRYLAQGQVGVAWESARERDVLLRTTAPHLVTASPFLIPYDDLLPRPRAVLVGTGTRIGAALCRASGTPAATMPWPRRISAQRAHELAPSLRTEHLRGALLCWDGQLEDDVRLVVAVARTAARHGAIIATRCAVEVVEQGSVTVRDRVTDRTFTVATKHVINASGVWAGELDPAVRLRPSKGIHLIVPSALLGNPRAGLTVPVVEEPGRWVFALPSPAGYVLVGITDTPFTDAIPDIPPVDAGDETYLLGLINRALNVTIGGDDVIGRFAGLRPLLAGSGDATSDLSRRHALVDDARTGMVTIVGGKLTTYRSMAEDAVDHLARRTSASWGPSPTARLPLVGAAPRSVLNAISAPQRLIRRFGAEAPDVAALADGRPELLEPIAEGVAVLGVELIFGLREELAMTVDDLLDRRTRLGLVPAQRRSAEDAVTALVATELPG